MFRFPTRYSLVLLLGILPAVSSAGPLPELSLHQLEQRRREIDAQLKSIATYSLGSGLGAIGYRSNSHETEDHAEWIEVDLGAAVPLDEIILVPTIRRDPASGFQADAFPKALRVRAGRGPDRDGEIVAEYLGQSRLLPRIAPVVIPGGGRRVSWIRIEALTLSKRDFDGRYVFQLAEILAFSGQENVALRKPVKSAAGNQPSVAPGWAEAYATDGVLPYLMAAADGKRSVAYVSRFELGDAPAITIDLGSVQRINQLHLHAVDQSDTVPQAFAGDFGIPHVLRVDGASLPDFSDAKGLLELRRQTIYDVGPILMRTFPATDCRYVRLRSLEGSSNPLYGPLGDRFGFAEIEICSNGQNVALHRPVTANFNAEAGIRRLPNLTDGRNYYGSILPLRDWLNQLAARHELESERPLVVAELNGRYSRQRAQFVQLAWLTALLGCGVVGVALASRLQRRRAIAQIRTRIAADLHDELGADLHAIGLLSDLAKVQATDPGKLADLLDRTRALTERAGQAARYCTNMLEAPGLYGNLAEDVRRASARILADLEHTLEIDGAESLEKLDLQKRIDLLLFYQECLINIIRHSGATLVRARLWVENGRIHLLVADNGQGLQGAVPSSLKRRARLLGAQLEAEKSQGGGLQVRLRLRLHRWRLFS